MGRRAWLAVSAAVSMLVALALLPLFSPAAQAANDDPPRKIVTGWMPYWNTKGGMATIMANPDLFPEVMPFWYSVKSQTNVLDQYDPANAAPMSDQVKTLQAAGIKVVPTLTDGTGKLAMQKLLADATKRSQLVKTLADLASKNNFDGLDLDWEGFAFTDGTASWTVTSPLWTTFVKELATKLHAQGDILSVTTPEVRDPASGKKGYWVYNWPEIGPIIDRLRIMTYDYSVANPGPIGPLSWVDQITKYASTLMAPSKIWVGVPTYGRDWVTAVEGTCPDGVDLIAPQGATAGTKAVVNSKDAAALAASYQATPVWTESYGEYSFNYTKVYAPADGAPDKTCVVTRTVWYQDARSVAARAALVAKYRIGGVALWSLGIEDPLTWPSIRLYAKTIAPDVVLGSIDAPTTPVDFATPVTLTATFKVSDSRPVVGAPISFQMMRNSDTDWREIATATTSVTGIAQIKLVASQYVQVRAVAPGTWERLTGTSAAKNIAVQRLIGSLSANSPRVGAKVVVKGRILPAEAVDVSLEECVDGAWVEVASGASGYDGVVTLSASVRQAGFHTYRISARSDSHFETVISQSITSIVR